MITNGYAPNTTSNCEPLRPGMIMAPAAIAQLNPICINETFPVPLDMTLWLVGIQYMNPHMAIAHNSRVRSFESDIDMRCWVLNSMGIPPTNKPNIMPFVWVG